MDQQSYYYWLFLPSSCLAEAGLQAWERSIREFKEEVHAEDQPAKPDNDKDTPEA